MASESKANSTSARTRANAMPAETADLGKPAEADSESAAAESTAWMSRPSITVEVYANERRLTVFNEFSAKSLFPADRFEYSDADGKRLPAPQMFPLNGDDWMWVSEWRLVVDDSTDADGWSYAFNFVGSTWYAECKARCHTRRRKWVRTQEKIDDDLLAARAAAADAHKEAQAERARAALEGVRTGGRVVQQNGAGASNSAPDTAPKAAAGAKAATGGAKTVGPDAARLEAEQAELLELRAARALWESEGARLRALVEDRERQIGELASALAGYEEDMERIVAQLTEQSEAQARKIRKLQKRLQDESARAEDAMHLAQQNTTAEPSHGPSLSVTDVMSVHLGSDTHWEFVVTIGASGRSVRRRFSRFHALHEALAATAIAPLLPPFPAKKLFGNGSKSLANERLVQLDAYLRAASSHDLPDVSAILELFLHEG